jgi:hypothetical protein
MAFSYSALKDLLAEDGRDDLLDQVENSTALVDFKMADDGAKNQNKVFEVMRSTDAGRVQVDNSGFASGGFVSDGGTRRVAKQGTYASGTYGYAMLALELEYPEGIVRVARGGDGIDLYEQAMAKGGRQFARMAERAIVGHELALPENAETAGSNVVVEVTSIAGFQVGGLVDIYAANGTTLKQSDAEVTVVTDDGDGTGAVTIATLSTNLLTTDRIFIAGSNGANAVASASTPRCVNLQDITTAATAMYAGLAAADQPSGTLDSTTTSWSSAAGKRLMARVFRACGEKPTHLIADPYQEQKIYESQNQTLRHSPGDTLDAYAPRMEFDGCPVVVCNSQNSKRVDFVNAKKHSAKLHVFWEPSPVGDGGSSAGWSRESLQLSQSRHAWWLPISSGLNMRVPRRNAFGAMNNLSAAF